METTAGSRADRPFFRFSLRGLAALVAVLCAALAVWVPRLENRYRAWRLAEANEQLLVSAAKGDLRGVSEAIAAGADLKARVSPAGRALYYAVDRENDRLLELLLQAGAPPDATFLRDTNETTALEVAVRQEKINIARRLLELGADPNGPTVRNGIPLLTCAVLGNVEMAEMLLDLGADVNGWNESGRSLQLPGQPIGVQLLESRKPLYMAVTANLPHAVRARMVRLLLERGADPLPEASGAEAMDHAIRTSDSQLAELLRECGVDSGPREAVAFNRLDEVKRLVREQPSLLTARYRPFSAWRPGQGQTLLGIALHKGHSEMARFLIEQGAPLNIVEGTGQTLVHFAARGGDAEMIRLLVDRGLDVDARDEHQNTPLIDSVWKTSPEVVRALIDAGADVNARGSSGRTALHLAASYDRIDMVRLLLSNGADPTIPDDRGATVVDGAHRSAELRALLQEHGFPAGE